MLRWLRSLFTVDPKDRVQQRIQVGNRHLAANRYRKAFHAFKTPMRRLKTSRVGEVLDTLKAYLAAHAAIALGFKQEYQMAETWVNLALAAKPDYAKAHEVKARTLTGLLCFEEAGREVEPALQLNREAEEYDPGIEEALQALIPQLRREGVEIEAP